MAPAIKRKKVGSDLFVFQVGEGEAMRKASSMIYIIYKKSNTHARGVCEWASVC